MLHHPSGPPDSCPSVCLGGQSRTNATCTTTGSSSNRARQGSSAGTNSRVRHQLMLHSLAAVISPIRPLSYIHGPCSLPTDSQADYFGYVLSLSLSLSHQTKLRSMEAGLAAPPHGQHSKKTPSNQERSETCS